MESLVHSPQSAARQGRILVPFRSHAANFGVQAPRTPMIPSSLLSAFAHSSCGLRTTDYGLLLS